VLQLRYERAFGGGVGVLAKVTENPDAGCPCLDRATRRLIGQ